ncbi:unnamed protein product [Pleuronectes platessa]|uniref:Uncharacterized protein n=1 Tax=Pleuronectes platessa TaxID=8262 RepID=A0A9N7UQN8_PLEPL|nr:unnamed protein product [Pleuronectes platessa]
MSVRDMCCPSHPLIRLVYTYQSTVPVMFQEDAAGEPGVGQDDPEPGLRHRWLSSTPRLLMEIRHRRRHTGESLAQKHCTMCPAVTSPPVIQKAEARCLIRHCSHLY